MNSAPAVVINCCTSSPRTLEPFARSKQVSSTAKTSRSSSAWPSSDQTTHFLSLPPPEPSRLMATIINILERTRGGGHAGNRRAPGTPVLVTVVTLLLFAITIATVLGSDGQDAADGRCVGQHKPTTENSQRLLQIDR